jgi:hypothetical protein
MEVARGLPPRNRGHQFAQEGIRDVEYCISIDRSRRAGSLQLRLLFTHTNPNPKAKKSGLHRAGDVRIDSALPHAFAVSQEYYSSAS